MNFHEALLQKMHFLVEVCIEVVLCVYFLCMIIFLKKKIYKRVCIFHSWFMVFGRFMDVNVI